MDFLLSAIFLVKYREKDVLLSECRDSNPKSLVPKTRMLAVTPHSDVRQQYHILAFYQETSILM